MRILYAMCGFGRRIGGGDDDAERCIGVSARSRVRPGCTGGKGTNISLVGALGAKPSGAFTGTKLCGGRGKNMLAGGTAQPLASQISPRNHGDEGHQGRHQEV
eukprot:5530319-Prymnesium_polylepis.1